MRAAASPKVALGFEDWLVEQLQPIRGFALAAAIYHLFDLGLAETLLHGPAQSTGALAAHHDLDRKRLMALLHFLQAEDFLRLDGETVQALPRLRDMEKAWPWYEMLIGGYGRTFLDIGVGLRSSDAPVARDGALVGSGSCKISHYDAIPLTRTLLGRMPAPPCKIIDIGCGNALYLEELCMLWPDLVAVGVEPDRKGHTRSTRAIAASANASRIRLYCASGQEFIAGTDERDADALIVAFVLQEILGQDGREGVLAFLRATVSRFPDAHMVVIEVDDQSGNPAAMRHALARSYYNPYFLVHPFTRQSLAGPDFWKALFAEAGLALVGEATTDPAVDSTGFEIGFLLKRA